MLIKLTEFNGANYEDIKVISNTDSGMFAVQYEQVAKSEPPKLAPDRSYHYDNSSDYYSLTIPKPKQRNVLRSVMIARTSTNHYEIAYADALGCVFDSAKSMSAVHEFLSPLWQRKLTK